MIFEVCEWCPDKLGPPFPECSKVNETTYHLEIKTLQQLLDLAHLKGANMTINTNVNPIKITFIRHVKNGMRVDTTG